MDFNKDGAVNLEDLGVLIQVVEFLIFLPSTGWKEYKH